MANKMGPVGVAGNTGYYDYPETGEYLDKLVGTAGMAIYDKMRRSDPQVGAVLRAITLPIRQAAWYIEPASDEQGDVEIAETLEEGLLRGMSMTWDDTLRHMLLMLPFGFSILEKVWEYREELIMPRKLDPRLPQSVVRWKYDKGKRRLIGPVQQDTDGTEIQLPIEKLLVFTSDKEGDNWEGTSVLRTAYKPWYIKTNLEKIDAIKHDRHGVGIPVMHLPQGIKEGSEEFEKVQSLLEDIYASEVTYVAEPEGYTFRVEGGGQKAGTDAIASVRYHDEKIATAMLAMFLYLGTTESGSRALGTSFIDAFRNSLQAYANYICDVVNRFLIREWVDYNWSVEGYPQLKAGKIQNVDPAIVAELISKGALTRDNALENALRDILELPELQEDEEPEDEEETESEPEREPGDAEEEGEEGELPEGKEAADEKQHAEHLHTFGWQKAGRELTETERLADIPAIELALNRATESLADALLRIKAEQTQNVIMQIVGGRKIQQINVPAKKDMHEELMRAYRAQYRQGKREAAEEIARQRSDLTAADPIPEDELFELVDEELAAGVEGASNKLKAVVYTEALELKKKGLTGDELRLELETKVEERLSGATWNVLASSAVNQGWGQGRQAGQKPYTKDIDYVYRSAILDGKACSVCRAKDQSRHEWGDPEYMTPDPECLGGGRCRCINIAVMQRESEVT